MASFNRVILVGNLTRDIELKYTPGGTAVTDVGVAVNDRRKNASGEWVDETTFVDVTLWGRTAEVASEYLGKGSPILVEGRLKLDTWETDGQKRSKLRVVCERMQMLGGPSGGGGGGRSRQDDRSSEYEPSHDEPPGRRETQPTGSGPGYDDPDIPF
jgi:single-strand DNA-binding protein